jgi:hypothetical protein
MQIIDLMEGLFRRASDAGDPDQSTTFLTAMDNLERGDFTSPAPLDAALYYAGRAMAVFPITPGTKIPYKHSRGCKDATTDPDTIRRWWGTGNHNIAMATGELFDVLDVDGPEGIASLERLNMTGWPVRAVTMTPRGLHIWCNASGSPNGQRLMPGIDFRGSGGYVILPPSVVDGFGYVWLAEPVL